MENVYNDLTRRLDELSGRDAKAKEDSALEGLYRHYLYEPSRDWRKGCIAIRVPGGTVGGVYFTEDGTITEVAVDTDYVVAYVTNVSEVIDREFVGKKLVISK